MRFTFYFMSRNFREFREFCPNSRKFMHAKFFTFFFFSPNLLAALDNTFISLLFLSGSKRFLSIRESLRREKFYFGRFAKVYARQMQKFREFFRSRKFLLAKISAPKVYILLENSFCSMKVKKGIFHVLLIIILTFRSTQNNSI